MKVLTIDETIRAVLAQANAEQNQHWPPHVIDIQYNLVTDALLDEGVKTMGTNKFIKEIMRPFHVIKLVVVKHGRVEIPEDFRNLAGIGVYLKEDNKQEVICDVDDKEPTEDEMKEIIAKSQSVCRDLEMVEIDEWNDLTSHSYKAPTLQEPIGCIFESEYIKVAPYNIQAVELRYIRKPKIYRYGYGMNADDTFYYDPTMKGAVESEWGTNARTNLFKGMNLLYSIYAKDGDNTAGALHLNKEGLF